jgi:hypothetical protein
LVRIDATSAAGEISGFITQSNTGAFMLASGELIRSMNYVEDITTTLRRICISIPSMNAEERKRLAESLRAAGGALNDAIKDLEKAVQ